MAEVFQRDAVEYLKKWKVNPTRKPLVIRGARQVGKTTLVNFFAKEFKSYVYLNLEIKENAQIFESGQSIDEIVTAIFFMSGEKMVENSSLLFIDEIQNSASAVMMLRYFY